jgi:hypothetical protein
MAALLSRRGNDRAGRTFSACVGVCLEQCSLFFPPQPQERGSPARPLRNFNREQHLPAFPQLCALSNKPQPPEVHIRPAHNDREPLLRTEELVVDDVLFQPCER